MLEKKNFQTSCSTNFTTPFHTGNPAAQSRKNIMIFRSVYIIITNSSEKIMRFLMRPAISHLLVCSLHHKISIKIQINALNVRKINHPSFSSHFKNLCCTRRIESFCSSPNPPISPEELFLPSLFVTTSLNLRQMRAPKA